MIIEKPQFWLDWAGIAEIKSHADYYIRLSFILTITFKEG